MLLRFALRQYLASPLYTGRQAEPERHAIRAIRVSSRLRSIMPKALRARISWAVRRMRPRLRLIDALAGLAGSRAGCSRARKARGKSHLAAIWAQRGRGAAAVGARARDEPMVPAALATGALVVEDLRRRRRSTSGRCFTCSISRARRRPSSCSPRAARRPSWPATIARSGVAASRRCRW